MKRSEPNDGAGVSSQARRQRRRRFLSPTAKCIRQNAKRPHPLSPSLHPVLFSLFSQSLTFFFSVFSTFPFLPIYVFSFSLLLSLSLSVNIFLFSLTPALCRFIFHFLSSALLLLILFSSLSFCLSFFLHSLFPSALPPLPLLRVV